jgi:hypothetical protein
MPPCASTPPCCTNDPHSSPLHPRPKQAPTSPPGPHPVSLSIFCTHPLLSRLRAALSLLRTQQGGKIRREHLMRTTCRSHAFCCCQSSQTAPPPVVLHPIASMPVPRCPRSPLPCSGRTPCDKYVKHGMCITASPRPRDKLGLSPLPFAAGICTADGTHLCGHVSLPPLHLLLHSRSSCTFLYAAPRARRRATPPAGKRALRC